MAAVKHKATKKATRTATKKAGKKTRKKGFKKNGGSSTDGTSSTGARRRK